MIADIFGSSDEDEEFEGFAASEVPKKEKKKKSGEYWDLLTPFCSAL